MANKKPNTTGLKPFKAGQSGNPGGKTSEQRKMEIANAERATKIRARMLEALEALMLEHPEKERIVDDLIKGDNLRLIKEAEDRGLGTPVQSINHESKDGSMSPKDTGAAVLDALSRKHAPDA